MQSLVTRCERRHNPASQRKAVSTAQRADVPLSQKASTTHSTESQPAGFSRVQDAVFFVGCLAGSVTLFGTCYVLASVMTSGVSA